MQLCLARWVCDCKDETGLVGCHIFRPYSGARMLQDRPGSGRLSHRSQLLISSTLFMIHVINLICEKLITKMSGGTELS